MGGVGRSGSGTSAAVGGRVGAAPPHGSGGQRKQVRVRAVTGGFLGAFGIEAGSSHAPKPLRPTRPAKKLPPRPPAPPATTAEPTVATASEPATETVVEAVTDGDANATTGDTAD